MGWLDRLLENDLPGAEVAGASGSDGFLADVGHPVLEHAARALGAGADGVASGEIDFGGLTVRARCALTEIKLHFVFRGEPEQGGEGAAHFALKALEGADFFLGEEFFHLGRLDLAAGDDFPVGEIAGGALVLFVRFLDDAAAFGAGGGEDAEIAGNGVAFVLLGLADDGLGHGGDLLHELRATEFAAFHLLEFELPVAGQLG